MKRDHPISRIVVFGAGALGSLIGGQLASSIPVTLIGRKRQIQAIRDNGLRLLTGQPEKVQKLVSLSETFEAYTELSQLHTPLRNSDVILLCVKASQVSHAVDQLLAVTPLNIKPTLLTFQNGTGFEENLRPLSENGFRIHLCVSHLGAFIHDAGLVEDCGGHLLLPDVADNQALLELFKQSNLQTELVENINEARWKKITFNCALNPFCALLDVRNNATLTEALLPWRKRIIQEVYSVATAANIELPSPADLLEEFEALVKASDNVNSMLQDIRCKRPTEILFLNGAIHRMAEKREVLVPGNRLLTHWIQQLEHARNPKHLARLRKEACIELFEGNAPNVEVIPCSSTRTNGGD